MTITLYNVKDDPKTVPKDLSVSYGNLTGTVRDEINILNPTIRMEFDDPDLTYNYAYISEFNRYYYLRECVCVRNNIYDVTFEVDVLQSHYDEFFNCPVIVNRSDSTYNTFIADDKRQYYQYQHNQYVTIGDIGLPTAMIVTTVG